MGRPGFRSVAEVVTPEEPKGNEVRRWRVPWDPNSCSFVVIWGAGREDGVHKLDQPPKWDFGSVTWTLMKFGLWKMVFLYPAVVLCGFQGIYVNVPGCRIHDGLSLSQYALDRGREVPRSAVGPDRSII